MASLKLYGYKACEAAALWSCGDILAQFVTEQMLPAEKKKGAGNWYNPKRTMRSAAFAATVYTPLAVTWYSNLARRIPGSTVPDLAKKVAADQLVFGPTLIGCFFFIMPMFEGIPPTQGINRVKTEFWPSLKMNWSVWGPVQVMNFSVIPPQHWVLVCNCVSIPWSAFLAYRNAVSTA